MPYSSCRLTVPAETEYAALGQLVIEVKATGQSMHCNISAPDFAEHSLN